MRLTFVRLHTGLFSYTLFLIVFLTYGNTSVAQFFSDEKFDQNELKDWRAATVKEYNGAYLFGFSESECELRIISDGEITVAQMRYYKWEEGQGFTDTFRVFSNVHIEGNKLKLDDHQGEFVRREHQKGISHGILLKPPFFHAFHEGGEYGPMLPEENGPDLMGWHTEASKKVLYSKDLEAYTSKDLKYMRNEIFARYGYIFKEGGEMHSYFSKQDWYHPQYNDVSTFLTEIEKRNIETILKAEKEKN